jgi:transposase
MNRTEATGASELEGQNMTTLQLNGIDTRPASLPADLRETLGEQILLRLALDAVQSLDPEKMNRAFGGGPNLRPQMMLTLLSYCYAAKIYGSLDIEWAAQNDKTVRYICARIFPDWHAVRQFRRKNRELLEQALTYVVRRAWLLQNVQVEETATALSWPDASQWERLAAEARGKIDTAILFDGLESD